MRRMVTTSGVVTACLIFTAVALADSWSTYLHDNARSGITDESLGLPLVPVWTYEAVVPPAPAWTTPAKEADRLRFDDAFHAVVADGRVFFGSSGDDKVYALSAADGSILWTFFTDGPVRLAPSVWEDRVYFGSDDGHVYCLSAADGQLIWKHRVADSDDRVIGHGRMISLWPVRTGVIIDDGIAYCGAGIFPSEGIYIAALDARTGEVLWRNDDSGDRGPEQQYDGISPQGYLLASKSSLYVPSGRAMPAAFDRSNGRFQFYLQPGGKVGGSYAILTGEHVVAGVNDQRAYDQSTGKTSAGGYAWAPAHRLIVDGNISYSLTDHDISALDRSRVPEVVKERNEIAGKREIAQKTVRRLYYDRTRLDKKSADYQQQYDKLTKQIDALLSDAQQLAEQQKELEKGAVVWQRDNDCRDAMILAGEMMFVGGDNRVLAIDATNGQWLWTGSVTGRASGLAVADGKLYVSTDRGTIHCFEGGSPLHARSLVVAETASEPYPRDGLTDMYAEAAEQIVAESGIRKGFCLVVGSGKGRLALELARRTELSICCVDPDAEDVVSSRRAIDSAGLYGKRITIDQAPLDDLPYPPYFANLIVSDDALATGKLDASADEIYRVLRPSGGVLMIGQPATTDATQVAQLDSPAIRDTLQSVAKSESPQVLDRRGNWIRLQRATLPGGGSWTHQYSDMANTANSGDRHVSTPLGVVWFGRPGPERMVERHARAAAPLAYDGRLFVQGENVVMAYDMYNGTCLWEREIPGAVRVRVDVDGSNLAIGEPGLFVATRDRALRLDPATGETIATYEMPLDDSVPRRWGIVASVGDTLLGTSTAPLDEEYGARWQNPSEDPIDNLNAYRSFNANGGMWRYMMKWPDWGREDTWKGALTGRMITADSLFALDVATGEPRWIYRGAVSPLTIAIAEGVVYLADNEVNDEDRRQAVAARRERYGLLTDEDEAVDDFQQYDVRRLVAIDLASGSERWSRIVDLTGSGGDKLGLAVHDGLLLAFGHFSNHDGSQFSKGGLAWRRVSVLNAADGVDVWSKELNYLRRPFIMGDQLVIEPRACDLSSGELRTRQNPVTGETDIWEFKRGGHSCGICTASEDCFFLRSDSINYYDVERDHGMLPIGGTRAGCWINMITAGGLALLPEASAGCTCSFPIRTTVALAPQQTDRTWSIYVTPGPITPVRHWFINLGAPGDRKDDDGNVWFGYPRLGVGYGVKFSLAEALLPEGRFFSTSPTSDALHQTDKPWVYCSGAEGLTRCELPLLDEGQSPAEYTVRLGFCDPVHNEAGKRVFDIKLQGQVVAADFDIAAEVGGRNRGIVKEFARIPVDGKLVIELVPKTTAGSSDGAPLLNSIEVVRP